MLEKHVNKDIYTGLYSRSIFLEAFELFEGSLGV